MFQLFTGLSPVRRASTDPLGAVSNAASSSSANGVQQHNLSDNFHRYLRDARRKVRDRHEACKVWQYSYDGINPPPKALDGQQRDRLAVDDVDTSANTTSEDLEVQPAHQSVATTVSNEIASKAIGKIDYD